MTGKISPLKHGEFTGYVELELSKARTKHGDVKSMHEAYAIIHEELLEFRDMVYSDTCKLDPIAAGAELVQISAMAQRVYEDLIGFPPYDFQTVALTKRLHDRI